MKLTRNKDCKRKHIDLEIPFDHQIYPRCNSRNFHYNWPEDYKIDCYVPHEDDIWTCSNCNYQIEMKRYIENWREKHPGKKKCPCCDGTGLVDEDY